MKISVIDIPITGREYEFCQDNISLAGHRLLKPVYFKGKVYKSNQDVRVIAKLLAQIEAHCHRCLESFAFDIDTELEVFYQPAPSRFFDEEEVNIEDLGVVYYRDGVIDLSDTIRDTIIVEIPMQLLCNRTCQGLCSQCGINLNHSSCQCQKTRESNNPFKEFFQQ